MVYCKSYTTHTHVELIHLQTMRCKERRDVSNLKGMSSNKGLNLERVLSYSF